jgi:hypothetical protein
MKRKNETQGKAKEKLKRSEKHRLVQEEGLPDKRTPPSVAEQEAELIRLIDDRVDRRFQKLLEDFRAVSPGHGPGRGYKVEKAKKFTVSMAKPLYDQLAKVAKKSETSVSSHVSAAVQLYLATPEIEKKRRQYETETETERD